MSLLILAKEIRAHKQKIQDLKKAIEVTTNLNEKEEAEFVLEKAEFEKKIIETAKLYDKHKYKLDYLEEELVESRREAKALDDDIYQLELECQKDTFEFGRLDKELADARVLNKKEIQKLKEELAALKEELREERQIELELEKSSDETRLKGLIEMEEKLKKIKAYMVGRYERELARYVAQQEPLIFRIKCLDEELESLSKEMLAKPLELQALKRKNLALTKKLEKEMSKRWFQEAELTTTALGKALAYFQETPESLTEDVILGVFVAKANFEWIIGSLKHYFNNNSSLSREVEKLIRQCDDIIELREPESLPILNKTLWKDAAGDLKLGDLHLEDEFLLPEFDSCQKMDAYMMKGTPDDSDFCINELFISRCRASDYCWLSEANGGYHSGYKTTHRLLYFQIATKLKCEQVNPKFFAAEVIKKTLCQQMLSEARALFREPHLSLFKDLFMEQIALCGLEGYAEFAPNIWRKVVRSWQGREGCFDVEMNSTSCSFDLTSEQPFEKKMQKRRDTAVDGCRTHVTAVAVSAMAFFLRFVSKAALGLSF